MPWPTASDLQTFLTESGLTVPEALASTDRVDAAIAEFESLSGWKPFAAITSTRHFRAGLRGTLLPLGGGLLSVESVASGGRTLTEGQDFWLIRHFGSEDFPAEAIEFACAESLADCVVITGLWGRMEDPSPAARLGVLQLAASMTLSSLAEQLAARPVSWQEGASKETYSRDLGKIGAAFRGAGERIARTFLRTAAGL